MLSSTIGSHVLAIIGYGTSTSHYKTPPGMTWHNFSAGLSRAVLRTTTQVQPYHKCSTLHAGTTIRQNKDPTHTGKHDLK